MRSAIMFPTSLPKFDYYRPRTLEEALRLLNELEGAEVLAGGTDLLVDMKSRVKRPKAVVDVKGIEELRRLEFNNGLKIGATVTVNELIRSAEVREKYYALWEASINMCDFHLRNRATAVGNICNASPAADLAPPLLVHDAAIELASVDGSRVVPLREFFTGVKRTVKRPNELAVSIRVPEPPRGAKSRYLKFGRSAEDLAVVGIAALASEEAVRLAYASVAPTPLLVDEVEEVFKEGGPKEELIEKAVQIALSKVSPITDVRGTREYRLHLVEHGTRFLLRSLLGVDRA